MKCKTMAIWTMVTGFVLSLPVLGVAVETPEVKFLLVTEAQQPKKKAEKPPVYKPPSRGAPAPGRRIGGGTRGVEKELPVVMVLAPDHTGLTRQEQPTLYWFTSKPVTTPVQIEVTLIDQNGISPVVETRLSSPVRAGMQKIRLGDYGIRLIPGKLYQWSVALVLDPEHRSKDIVATGAIERIEQGTTGSEGMTAVTKAEAPSRYAEAGLWYDSLMAISELIEASPRDQEFRRNRAALLEQIGLPEVGAYDMKFGQGEAG